MKPEVETNLPDKRIAEALARVSYAQEYSKRRRKPWVWVTAIVLLALTVGPPVWAYFAKGSLIRIFWFIPSGVGLVLLTGLLQYTKGSPICPQCHEDVTSCFAAHCQACGEKLARGRCARCGLDTTLAAGFSTGLIRQHIRHCPGCGVFLNTNFYRDEFLGG